MPHSLTPRIERFDVIRGLAVFGILLVNVWSMAGDAASTRYGLFSAGSPLADKLSAVLVAFFAEGKFYPLFAFLFGAGFALQTAGIKKSLVARGAEVNAAWKAARQVFRQRMLWLLLAGLLHGSLIWFGDILTTYGLCGLWMLSSIGTRMRLVVRRLRRVFIWTFILTILLPSFAVIAHALLKKNAMKDALETVIEARHIQAVFYTGSWLEIATLRVQDYVSSCVGLIFFLPQIAVLFLLGIVSVRLGWLTQPERHQALWRKVRCIGLTLGVPANLWWAWTIWRATSDPTVDATLGYVILTVTGSLLASAYLASFMLAEGHTIKAWGRWLTPVGRMSLTNYLMQSVLLTVLLQGFGFGLGAILSPYQQLLLCFVIMFVQVLCSRWWLARHKQGPVEALWRGFYRIRTDK